MGFEGSLLSGSQVLGWSWVLSNAPHALDPQKQLGATQDGTEKPTRDRKRQQAHQAPSDRLTPPGLLFPLVHSASKEWV